MAMSQRKTINVLVQEIDGVKKLIYPRNVKYWARYTGGIAGMLRNFGRRREANLFEFPITAITDAEKGRTYYIDAKNKNGDIKHLEVTTKAVKMGTEPGPEGAGVIHSYKIIVDKTLNADSRLGPLRKPLEVYEVSETDKEELQKYNYAMK